MKPHIVLFGLALVLLSVQLGSAQAASCHDIEVLAEDIFIGRASTEYFYFPIHNYSDEDFEVYAAEAWKDSGEFEITLVDYPDDIPANGSGELTIKVKTGNLNNESLGSAFVRFRGLFSDGTYCGFTSSSETYFDVTVEMDSGNAQCGDLEIRAFDVYIDEDSDKIVSFEIENYSGEDFDLDGIEITESSTYFSAYVYSKPSVVRDNDTETFRVKISSNSVSGDRQGTIRLRAKGSFENGNYCNYGGTEEETFTVFVEESTGSGTTHSGSAGLYLSPGKAMVEKGDTGSATFFLENRSSENFSIDYVSVFDSSPNFSVETAGYERVVPAFGSGYINVKANAYDYAAAGKENAFIDIRGHFQNGQTVDVFGDSLGVFQVEIIEKQQGGTGSGTYTPDACPYVSLIVPDEKTVAGSGSVFITIDNRGTERVDVRIYGAGLTAQPNLISVPKKTLVSESVIVSPVLPETAIVYSIETAGCSLEKRTVLVSTAAVQQPDGNWEGNGTENEGLPFGLDSTGFVALGQAGAALGILVLAVAAIYLILRPGRA